MAQERMVVAGGGLAGLVASVVLAARGRTVVLVRKRAVAAEHDGFRFEIGPTMLTRPQLLARVFTEAGRDMEDELKLIRLDPQWRNVFHDCSVLDLVQDVDAMAQALERFMPGRGYGADYRRFMARARKLHEQFAQGQWGQGWLARRAGGTVAALINGHMAEGRVAQMMECVVRPSGAVPSFAPAGLCALAHVQATHGLWAVRGGMGAVIRALERLARLLGVDVREDMAESGPADRVVTGLGRPRLTPSGSAVVFLLGLERRFDQLLHHTVLFPRDTGEEAEFLYQRGEPAPDPTCFLTAPARTDPTAAPTGGEALAVLVPAPVPRPRHDWPRMLPALRRTVLDKLETVAGLHGLEGRIRVERVITPSDRPTPAVADMAEALEAGWLAAEALCPGLGERRPRGAAASRPALEGQFKT